MLTGIWVCVFVNALVTLAVLLQAIIIIKISELEMYYFVDCFIVKSF